MELHDYLICSNCDMKCSKDNITCPYCGFELPLYYTFTVRLKTRNRPYFINKHCIDCLDMFQELKYYSIPSTVLDTIRYSPDYNVLTIRYLLKKNKLSK